MLKRGNFRVELNYQPLTQEVESAAISQNKVFQISDKNVTSGKRSKNKIMHALISMSYWFYVHTDREEIKLSITK